MLSIFTAVPRGIVASVAAIASIDPRSFVSGLCVTARATYGSIFRPGFENHEARTRTTRKNPAPAMTIPGLRRQNPMPFDDILPHNARLFDIARTPKPASPDAAVTGREDCGTSREIRAEPTAGGSTAEAGFVGFAASDPRILVPQSVQKLASLRFGEPHPAQATSCRSITPGDVLPDSPLPFSDCVAESALRSIA
jgi:hypothetical protein